MHFGSHNYSYYGYYAYNYPYGNYKHTYYSVGIDLILGAEYDLANYPFTFQFQIKPFLDLYMSNIDKDSHVKIKSTLNKKESDWTTQDRLTSVMLIDKVVKPFKVAIQKPKIKR